jgi:hypothetical protein
LRGSSDQTVESAARRLDVLRNIFLGPDLQAIEALLDQNNLSTAFLALLPARLCSMLIPNKETKIAPCAWVRLQPPKQVLSRRFLGDVFIFENERGTRGRKYPQRPDNQRSSKLSTKTMMALGLHRSVSLLPS